LIDLAAAFGAPVIVGLLQADHLVDGDRLKTTRVFVDSMEQIAEHARRRDTNVLLEAINRYETPLLNTAAQTVDVVQRVGSATRQGPPGCIPYEHRGGVDWWSHTNDR
jgi:sugar phosphate isomerase/epimerase